MISPRLVRTLLIAVIAVALSYYIAERWPSEPAVTPIQEFCSTVVTNQPIQQILARAASVHLSTMVTDKLVRVYSIAARDQGECHIGHSEGLVTGHRLVLTR